MMQEKIRLSCRLDLTKNRSAPNDAGANAFVMLVGTQQKQACNCTEKIWFELTARFAKRLAEQLHKSSLKRKM